MNKPLNCKKQVGVENSKLTPQKNYPRNINLPTAIKNHEKRLRCFTLSEKSTKFNKMIKTEDKKEKKNISDDEENLCIEFVDETNENTINTVKEVCCSNNCSPLSLLFQHFK